MRKILTMIAVLLISAGCASVKGVLPEGGADEKAQAFFNALERDKREDAHGLFAKGLSQAVSYNQFDGFIDSIRKEWGRIESEETVLLPFHARPGEVNFIPLKADEKLIKRYTYEVTFEHAKVDFDLTLYPQEGQYKIIWMSVWGSTIYFSPEIREKIEGLFSKEPA